MIAATDAVTAGRSGKPSNGESVTGTFPPSNETNPFPAKCRALANPKPTSNVCRRLNHRATAWACVFLLSLPLPLRISHRFFNSTLALALFRFG